MDRELVAKMRVADFVFFYTLVVGKSWILSL